MSTDAADDEEVWERLRRKHWDSVRNVYATDGRIIFQCGVGWAKLIDLVFMTAGKVLADTGQKLRVIQIKQKLGGLRIAVDDLPQAALKAVESPPHDVDDALSDGTDPMARAGQS